MNEQAITMKKREPGVQGSRPKQAYISAPPTVDTRPIRRALEAKGVHTFSPDELEFPGGMLLTDVLHEGMKRADLLVAVIDPTPASNFVCYEVGYAQAIGKPAFIFLAEDASPAVWTASGTPYFRFDPENPSALDFAAQQILAIPPHGMASPPSAMKRSLPI